MPDSVATIGDGRAVLKSQRQYSDHPTRSSWTGPVLAAPRRERGRHNIGTLLGQGKARVVGQLGDGRTSSGR